MIKFSELTTAKIEEIGWLLERVYQFVDIPYNVYLEDENVKISPFEEIEGYDECSWDEGEEVVVPFAVFFSDVSAHQWQREQESLKEEEEIRQREKEQWLEEQAMIQKEKEQLAYLKAKYEVTTFGTDSFGVKPTWPGKGI